VSSGALLTTENSLAQLAHLADQSEALGTLVAGLQEGQDEIPPGQLNAWRRVLAGLAKGEGIEEWVVEPIARGLASAGLPDTVAERFLRSQGVDEHRHETLLLDYARRHWGELPTKPLFAHRVLYDGLFKAVIKQSERHPLRLLLPLWIYEKTVSGYLTRLMPCAGDAMPRLCAMMKGIRVDEARHVAGVGILCRALVQKQPPGALERGIILTLCRLVVWDMDRAAWWKPGLRGFMLDLGLDADAMRRDNDATLLEARALLAGR
jgi:hypothetical protein